MSYYGDIEQILGDSAARYFGHGYLNTGQELSELRVVSRGPGMVDFTGFGCIRFPEIWSVKGDSVQRPHMSSIDAIELATLIVEPVWNSLRTPEFPRFQLARIEVTGGSSPLEEGLDQVAITGDATHIDPHGGISVRAEIGNMKVRLWLRGTSVAQSGIAAQSQKVSVRDLIVAQNSNSAAAILFPPEHSTPWHWSLASCFASSLQLGQVLLYKLDNLDRASSNTLWMRKFTIAVNESIATQDGPQPIYATLRKVKLLEQGGETWRCADVNTVLCGVNLTCSVAHIVPNSSVAAKVA